MHTVSPSYCCAIRAFALLLSGCQPTEPDGSGPNGAFALGVNITEPVYFGTEVALLNLFKLSAPWFTQCDESKDPLCQPGTFVEKDGSSWDTHEQRKLDLDQNGYPRSLPDPTQRAARNVNFTSVATLVPTGLSVDHPSGRFVVRYEGEGQLEYRRGAVRESTLSRPGRDVLDVTTDGHQTWFQLAIRSTDPRGRQDYIRDIRVFQDGGACSDERSVYCNNATSASACGVRADCAEFEKTLAVIPFDPRFLARLASFRVIRFMGFQNTNRSVAESWSQRTRPDYVTWSTEQGDGGPVEMIAVLGNQLNADIWINIPTRANDDYVRQFATLVRQKLQKDLRVYVEYSNEVWNLTFAAGNWVEEQAVRKWPLAEGAGIDKRLQWYGMRTAQICDIWEEVWAADADRIICVMGAQAANPWTAVRSLDCPLWAAENDGRPCYRHHVDGLAIAPYFGFYVGSPQHVATLRAWTRLPDHGLGNLFNEIFDGGQFSDSPTGGALRQARDFIDQNRSVARRRGLQLLAYEGGQHLVAAGAGQRDESITELFIAANRDPRMGDAYRIHLNDWRAAGGGLYNLWNSISPYSHWGSWGLLEYRDQPSTPKYQAVIRLLQDGGQAVN